MSAQVTKNNSPNEDILLSPLHALCCLRCNQSSVSEGERITIDIFMTVIVSWQFRFSWQLKPTFNMIVFYNGIQ